MRFYSNSHAHASSSIGIYGYTWQSQPLWYIQKLFAIKPIVYSITLFCTMPYTVVGPKHRGCVPGAISVRMSFAGLHVAG
jgi:hypothetical protein